MYIAVVCFHRIYNIPNAIFVNNTSEITEPQQMSSFLSLLFLHLPYRYNNNNIRVISYTLDAVENPTARETLMWPAAAACDLSQPSPFDR